jgi:hypothetical protein
MSKIKINMFVASNKDRHEMRSVEVQGTILYSADDILRMLGYASVYSSKHNHHFVNGLRSKASCLYKLPYTLVAGKYKFWDKVQLGVVYKSFLGNGFKYLDNWYKVEELHRRPTCNQSTPEKVQVQEPVYDWYSEGDIPEVGTECEYSVSGSPFRWCTVKYIGVDILVISTKTKSDVVVDLETLELRPLELEKKLAVEAMMGYSTAGMSLSDFSAKLFEAGYKFVEEK